MGLLGPTTSRAGIEFVYNSGLYAVVCASCGSAGPQGYTELWAISMAKAEGYIFDPVTLKPTCPMCRPEPEFKQRRRKGGAK